MAIFDWSERIRASGPLAWALAALLFAAALLTRFASDHLLPPGFPYLTFFPAVILTAFFAGLWPGAACALASGLAAWYWFIPPFDRFGLDTPTLIALGFYVAIVTVDLAVIHLMQRSTERLRAERAISQGLQERQASMLEELKSRESRQRLLQRELAHRMKNTFSMVQAVVAQSLRHAPDLATAAQLASARIQALGRSQDMLTESRWESADIRHVIETSLEPHRDREERISLHGPGVELNAMQSMGLSLTLHELATNAAKYGALSAEAGRVAVRWECDGDGAFRLQWSETGGPPVAEPTRRGFGSRLTERVAPSTFFGTAATQYLAHGVVFRLEGRLRPAADGGEGAAA